MKIHLTSDLVSPSNDEKKRIAVFRMISNHW